MINADDVLKFWFQELSSTQWFTVSLELDQLIKDNFTECLEKASRGELWSWRSTPKGRLAEIIVLDQFSRNIHRGTPDAFSQDALALILSQELIFKEFDKTFNTFESAFAYMPYMHSESALIHNEALKLFSKEGLEFNLKFELEHKAIIDKFGRYPHRNQILGRVSSEEEIEFLKDHAGF